MTDVVDLGCVTWGADNSIEKLVERFHPERLYGFDPYPELHDGQYMLGETLVTTSRAAAWIHGHGVSFLPAGSRSRVIEGEAEAFEIDAQSFDFALWLDACPEPMIVKMDIEGAEHTLIPHLIEAGAIDMIELLLIEVHGDRLLPPLPVAWETWT